MEQKAEMEAKMGNWSCVLKELRMVDKDMELDLEAMLNNIKDMNIRDSWLLQQTIEDTRTCYAVRTEKLHFFGWWSKFKDQRRNSFERVAPPFMIFPSLLFSTLNLCLNVFSMR